MRHKEELQLNPGARQNKQLRESFLASRQRVLDEAQKHLSNPDNIPNKDQVSDDIDSCYRRRLDLLQEYNRDNYHDSSDFVAVIKKLAEIRDLRTGIKIHQILSEDGPPHLYIRDARACKKPYERGYESYEMSLLNAVSTAFDIMEFRGLAQSDIIKRQLTNIAIDFIEENNSSSDKPPLNPKQEAQATKRLKQKIKEVALVLKQHGIENPFKDLNEGKDYQNFNYEQADIITISEVKFVVDGSEIKETVIEAEVGLRGLTKDQKDEYQAIIDAKHKRDYINVPDWFKVLSENEKRFVEKYADKIIRGKYVHPTQLRRIAGIKNAFEKITAIYEDNEINELHGSLHGGTLGSVSKDKAASEKIADDNFRQAKNFIVSKHILHPNTLNTKFLRIPFISRLDAIANDNRFIRSIKSSSSLSLKSGDQRRFYTNTAFNAFRRVPGASQYGGVELLFEDIFKNIELKDEVLKDKIESYLKPRGFFKKAPAIDIRNLYEEIKGSEEHPEIKDLLKIMLDLSQYIKKAASFIDNESNNLYINLNLNLLAYKIEKLQENPEITAEHNYGLKGIKVEKILNMCASGKDRTGLSEHFQTAQAIIRHLVNKYSGITDESLLDILHEQILSSGHTGNMTGDPIAGGGSIGAYGTKEATGQGFPKKLRQYLESIIEKTSNFNNIKEGFFDAIKDRMGIGSGQKPIMMTRGYLPLIAEPIVEEDFTLNPRQTIQSVELVENMIKSLIDSIESAQQPQLTTKTPSDIEKKILKEFTGQISKQNRALNPDGLYKGVGFKIKVETLDGKKCFKILDVLSPEFKRFSASNGGEIDQSSLIGKSITKITVKDKGGTTKKVIDVNDALNNPADHNVVLANIVSHFRDDSNISFTTSDNQEYCCDKKTIFIGNNFQVSKPGKAVNRHQKYDPQDHGVPDNILKSYGRQGEPFMVAQSRVR